MLCKVAIYYVFFAVMYFLLFPVKGLKNQSYNYHSGITT